MYKYSIPIYASESLDKEATLKEIKRMNAKRVFIALDVPSFDKSARQRLYDSLTELIPFFKTNGIETGVWFWSFMRLDNPPEGKHMPRITGLDGSTGGNLCPSSKDFTEDTCDFVREIAKFGPDLMMFDDDFRYGFLSTGFGCCCENHLKMMSEKLDETVTREGLAEKMLCGGPNKYRDAWMDSLGEAMKNYASAVRAAVDEINPEIRFAVCSCMSLWDFDGVDTGTIAKILAGKTKPILRLIGAPYWADERDFFGQRLQHVIEYERMQASWLNKEEIEIMAEGDAYPRPRHNCSAAHLEGFDTAMHCVNATDGILKYGLSYTSSPRYETGYIDVHERNKSLYPKLDEMFADKTATGVRVYEFMNKLRGAELPLEAYVGPDHLQKWYFSPAAHMLSDNTVPICYSGEGKVGMAFGENARYLTDKDLENGLFIDIVAAKILMEKGIDVGIEEIGETIEPFFLYFNDSNEYIESYYGGFGAKNIKTKSGAEALVTSGTAVTKVKEYIDTFYYENANSQKFIVFPFDAYSAYKTKDRRFRSYAMQDMLYKGIERLGGKNVMKCKGQPDLYTLCKEDENSLSIGLWNFCPDYMETPVIELSEDFASAEFVNCDGKLEGRKVTLSKLHAYEFAFVNLRRK